jgi:hypothetical protein
MGVNPCTKMHKSWPTIPGGWSRLGWPACTKMRKRAQSKKAPGKRQ